jgi:prepilin-type N-terminal cleavage/methylation domain-containing protein/prepilin-type processing-associated H-X9-DG protein
MSRRGGGFTLIELLVVIAIIGILAAMLFPVFARARESARKVQCLSNVKNIAMAIQMYLTDYDAFPPAEHRQEAVDYFGDDCYRRTWEANPFLRWPVIFDEYVKNRDVWRCTSAKVEGSAHIIVPDYYPGGWLGFWQTYDSEWRASKELLAPCAGSWPPGWGGAITDTAVQQSRANLRFEGGDIAANAFTYGIAANEHANLDLKTSQIDDPSWWVVVGDQGANPLYFDPPLLAYPDQCAPGGCWSADWANCPWSIPCGPSTERRSDPNWQKQFARHLGGSNIGFADGHAAWMSARAILAESPRYACGCFGGALVWGKLKGFELHCTPTTAAGSPENGVPPGASPSTDCGVPPLW